MVKTVDFLDTNHWVPIHTLPGFEACIEYFISRDGEILSTKGGKERILRQGKNDSGYKIVHLRKRLGERGSICCTVHKLVAYAFLPPPPTPHGRGRGQSIIDHIDHDRTNNCVDNLRWLSASENCEEKIEFSATEWGSSDWYELKKKKNRDLMRRKRLDPEFRKKEVEAEMERYHERKNNPDTWEKFMAKKKAYKEANPEKEAEWMRKTLEKRAKDPERMKKLKDYKKNYRENVKNDPEKLEKQREYQREYMRKRRLKAKEDKLKNNAEASDGRAHSAELGEGQSTDGGQRKHLQ